MRFFIRKPYDQSLEIVHLTDPQTKFHIYWNSSDIRYYLVCVCRGPTERDHFLNNTRENDIPAMFEGALWTSNHYVDQANNEYVYTVGVGRESELILVKLSL